MTDERRRMAATPGMTDTLAGNITALAERRAAEALAAPTSDRLAATITRFAGSMAFVFLHMLLFGGWIGINTGLIPGVPRFDPTLVVLAMAASVEAIFLTTFVLIAQNRMQRDADRRADLDLHVSLLAEHELSRIGMLVADIANRLGVAMPHDDLAEIGEHVQPESVLAAIDEAQARREGSA